ncbi:hypothetical protein GCM10022224_046830 [Nonomuraea antimicrobica]|uniref:Uncharacterized protein n=1 Tax=Nonomuraea antimicrobica TaxID=561173 RepID=A0ABP7C290_9ACTN
MKAPNDRRHMRVLPLSEQQRRLERAHQGARMARLVTGLAAAAFGLFAMLASFMPTNYNWDSAMPDYSDTDMVFLATWASGGSVLLIAFAAGLLWRSRVMIAILALLLSVDLYRFSSLVPHYQG